MGEGTQGAGYSALAKAAGAYESGEHPLEALVAAEMLEGEPLRPGDQWRSLPLTTLVIVAILLIGGVAVVLSALS